MPVRDLVSQVIGMEPVVTRQPKACFPGSGTNTASIIRRPWRVSSRRILPTRMSFVTASVAVRRMHGPVVARAFWTASGRTGLSVIPMAPTAVRIREPIACSPMPSRKAVHGATIDTLPDVVGLCLHKDGHVGYTVGGGYAVEWQGTRIGCVKTVIANRKWTEWFELPFINYDGADLSAPADLDVPLGSRLLKRGLMGKDVKALQELLNQLCASLAVDGIFGSNTEAAVKAFQKKSGLAQDGKYGDKTHAALMAAVGDDDVGQPTATAEKPEDEPESQVASRRVIISSSGGKVNIRCRNGTGYSRISAVAPGTVLEYIATAQNGWHAVKIGSQVGWVSGEYGRLIAE